jgi:hypothetical protein
VAEVGGKHREFLFDVFAVTIPVKQRPYGEAMPEVVYARPGTIAVTAQSDLSGHAPKDTANVLRQQAAAPLADEEGRAAA